MQSKHVQSLNYFILGRWNQALVHFMSAFDSTPLCNGCGNMVKNLGCAACKASGFIEDSPSTYATIVLGRDDHEAQRSPCTQCHADGSGGTVSKRCIMCTACGHLLCAFCSISRNKVRSKCILNGILWQFTRYWPP